MTLIIAVDRPMDLEALSRACRHASGVKVGLPPILRFGVKWALETVESCRGMKILDLKLSDIHPIMMEIVNPFLGGFDAFIAHSFIGSRGALLELRRELDRAGAKLILVATMSHPGAREVYDKAWSHIARVIEEVDPWGLVAPATRPEVLREVRKSSPSRVILSPGIGAQGASPGDALCNGADYEIVGRMITSSRYPWLEAEKVKRLQVERLARCSGKTG